MIRLNDNAINFIIVYIRQHRKKHINIIIFAIIQSEQKRRAVVQIVWRSLRLPHFLYIFYNIDTQAHDVIRTIK